MLTGRYLKSRRMTVFFAISSKCVTHGPDDPAFDCLRTFFDLGAAHHLPNCTPPPVNFATA